MTKFVLLLFLCLFFLLLDIYVFQAIRTIWGDAAVQIRQRVYLLYWSISAFTFISIASYQLLGNQWVTWKTLSAGFSFIFFVSKLLAAVVLLFDDLSRLLRWSLHWVQANTTNAKADRSEFLSQLALYTAAVPLASMSFGILSGAHDYRVRYRRITLPHLPSSFHGIKLLHISDIHTGSFFNKTAVRGGIELIRRQKADLICFTGDLVNNQTSEIHPYFGILRHIQAPLGVYSILGNHDYGDYVLWQSSEEKLNNFRAMLQAHKQLGWRLLMDEHQLLTVDGDSLAILGVQNWGTGRFPKYGNLEKAYAGTTDYPVKILLSHDPSHWDAQIRPQYPDIDLTLSGHTHGMQFGIEVGSFRWSPVQYRYKQWADLYCENNQYLYVNRGFGYIGFPGRIGILPEITVIELNKA